MGILTDLVVVLAQKVPWEKLIVKEPDYMTHLDKLQQIVMSGQVTPPITPASHSISVENLDIQPVQDQVNERELILYQQKELLKQLIPLEMHLAQGCKIAGKACDCCAKHPLAIESLAEETVPMAGSNAGLYRDLAEWARGIGEMTSAQASESGQYDKEYPLLAQQARQFRKVISQEMLRNSPELREAVRRQAMANIDEELNGQQEMEGMETRETSDNIKEL